MTNDEALKLKPGDRVEAKYGIDEWVVAKVVSVEVVTLQWLDTHQNFLGKVSIGQLRWVMVRRLPTFSLDRKQRLYPAVRRSPRNLRSYDHRVTGNVFSDWLWENGYPEAADALRRAFPLVEG